MAANLGNQEYKASIAKWAKKVHGNLEGLARASIQEISQRVVQATPVDTGFLRGSWQPSIGEPKSIAGEADQNGARVMSEISLQLSGLKLGDKFYLLNNAAYARRVEYGFVGEDKLGRHYDQQGRYYVTDTVKQWPQAVAKMAKQLS